MDVLMPQLGETVTEGTVSIWHKRVGDRIQADEILLDVETDKASMEIPAPGAGRIKSILVEEGQTVEVGTVLAVIISEQEAQLTPPPPVVAAPESLAMLPGADAAVTAPDTRSATPPSSATPSAAPRQGALKLSPAVRRLVAEHDLDPAVIAGTGRSGRVTRRDVLAHVTQAATHVGEMPVPPISLETAPAAVAPAPIAVPATAAPPPAAAPAATAARAPAADSSEHREPFNRIRRLTAEHMLRSKSTSPHVLQAVEVDFSAVERARTAARAQWRDAHGYSLTYLPFIATAVCRALGEFPHANASVAGDGLVLHPHVNLAIAVDLGPGGLVAPVIRGAEALSLLELADAIHDIAERARGSRLRPDDLTGGTYTLSNSGTFGTLITAPIINQPQVAILSIDGVRKRPVVIEQEDGDVIAIRPIGILAQSFDHRAIDGAYSAAFLARVRALLEDSDWAAAL
jgi:pyruvate dehydrogenase E2 component (dihydrolipoyllysine-residue acetyltransferase)